MEKLDDLESTEVAKIYIRCHRNDPAATRGEGNATRDNGNAASS